MCTQRSPFNWSRELYQRHGETIERYLTEHVVPALREVSSNGAGNSLLLAELKHRWLNHQIMNKWLKKFFTYLDRYYVKHHSLPTLSQAGMRCFRTHVYDEMKGETTAAIIALINDERDGRIIDKSLIKSIVDLYESMGMGNLDMYNADLEAPLLVATREYYARKRDDWINLSTPEYLIKAEDALEAERVRVGEYLNPSSEARLLRAVEEEILEKVETVLLEKESSGCRALLQNERSEDLQRMFRLFNRLEDGLQPMADIFQSFVTDMGSDIISRRQARLESEKDKNDDPKFVKALIELHEKTIATVRNDFSGHAYFQKALKNAFVETVNKSVGQYSNAELMSTYCDRVLKSGGERLSENEVEVSLDQIVELFAYLTEKDMFAEYYRNQLAKRLLSQRSTSDDAEKLMITKLKVQCGTQFTSKMEGMLSDLAVGQQQRAEFEQRMRQIENASLDFSVQVLTVGFWPSYKSTDVTLTSEMTRCMNVFKEWHDTKHSKRKLQWIMTQGNASVRGTFGKKTFDFQVSTLQAIALDAFSDGVALTLDELSKKLNMEEHLLKPVMHSLSCGKVKVILKTPPGNKINGTDSFTANAKFTSNLRKIRIPMASIDSTNSIKRVEEDRSFAVEASIVRIMKARKTLKHQALVAEVMNQMSFFNPDVRTIKKKIESLIEREYLERNADNAGVYNYLA
jgi:cullin 1